jgi:hypothetical protein
MHVMIDLETMGTRPDAPIIAIGAVAFDGDAIRREFYANVDLGSSVNSGAQIDASTVMWWLKQSDAARAALTEGEAYSLVGALTELSNWIDWGPIKGVWGNGATFDNVILRQSYVRTAVPCPWPFWQDRCYRTVKSMYPDVAMVRSGTHHNALDDARTQAEHLLGINAHYGAFL